MGWITWKKHGKYSLQKFTMRNLFVKYHQYIPVEQLLYFLDGSDPKEGQINVLVEVEKDKVLKSRTALPKECLAT